jgi:sporulation integral membrane protein YtvI
MDFNIVTPFIEKHGNPIFKCDINHRNLLDKPFLLIFRTRGASMNTSYINNILKYLTYLFRFAFVLSIIIMCVVTSYYVVKYAYPFVIALLIAIFINPIVQWIEKRLKLPRTLAVLLVMLSILGILAGIVSLFTMELIDGLSSLMVRIPNEANVIMNFFNDFLFKRLVPFWDKTAHIFYSLDPGQQLAIRENIQGLNKEITTFISNLGTELLTVLTKFIVFLPSALAIIVIIFLSTFFMCKDWHIITRFLRLKLEKNIHAALLQVFQELREALSGYFRAQCALMSITGAVMIVCLSILQVEHAFTIAMITALVDFLPYIGTGAVLIPWSLYSLLTGHSVMALYLGLLYLLLGVIRQILEPKMLASSIGLNPLATLIVVFVGFKLIGILGLFAGPGLLVLIKALTHANVFQAAWRYITDTEQK